VATVKQLQRRKTLQAVAGVVSAAAVGTVAGRSSSPPSAPTTAALDAVPASADALVYADIDALRRDDGMKTLTTAALQQRARYHSVESAGEHPRNADTLLTDVETELDTDPKDVHRLTAFGDVGSSGDELFGGYGGVVLGAELNAEAVKAGLENLDDVAFDRVSESGAVVYEPESETGPWVGSLGSDHVVVGTETAVYDAIDVTNDGAAPIDGGLRRAYADSRDAPVRFASRLPSPSEGDAVPERVGETGRTMALTPLDHVSTLGGAVYRDGDVRGLETTLDVTDEAAARDVASVVRDLRERAVSKLRDDALADLVGDIGVERDGATVTTSVTRTTGELEPLVDRD